MKQFTIKGHNWVSFTYCDFNLYLVTNRLIHKFKSTGWLQGHLSLSSLRDWFNECQEFLVKSKLSPHSGSVEPWGSCTPYMKRCHKVFYIWVFQIALSGSGKSEILQLVIFLLGEGNLRRSDFWRFEPFSKLKTAFCQYWT